MEMLVDRRWVESRWQYRVRWEDYGPEHDTWEDERNIFDPELIEEFHASRTADAAPSPLAEIRAAS